jgi:amino acid transporter
MAEAPRALRRDLGLPSAVAVVVGSMIGVGIFLGPRVIAQHLPTPGLVLLAWILGGLLVFCGALTYAELGAALPRSGGPYAYIRETYGPLVGFFSGWSGFAVGKAASVSALAVAFVEFLPAILRALAPDAFPAGAEFTRLGTILVAATLIGALTLVNVLGVRFAGGLAVFTMVVKVGALLLLVLVGIAVFAPQVPGVLTQPMMPATSPTIPSIASAFGLALIPVFFAYDGWVNSTQVAEEVRDPERNVPRSVILGTLGVVTLYALANLAYLLALGPERIGETGAAANTASVLFGDVGGPLVTAAILVSIIGTINAVILSGPRIAYAMARDGVFPRSVERVTRWGTPGWSIALQAAISIGLILLPPIGGQPLFETLLTYIIVDSFIFYALGALAVILLRRRMPDLPRPYKVPLYPFVPIAFIVGALAFLVNVLVTTPLDSIAGILLVLAAFPIYAFFSRRERARRLREVTYSWDGTR